MAHGIRSSLAAAGRWVQTIGPERAHLRADLVAGLPRAIASVPDGMAAAVLAGVNPAPPDRAPQWAGARVRGHPGRW